MTDLSIKKGFKVSDGPYVKSLSQSLTSLNIERQAYQGGTFVGNHVNKLLKVRLFLHHHTLKLMVNLTLQPGSIDSLLSGVVRASTNSNLVAPTQAMINKFTEVFLLFGKCHAVYNGNVVDDKEITQLGKIDITNNL